MKPVELDKKSIASLLPERPKRSNKATFGKVLCAAGSYCMSGAAYLSAKAAYRTGAGLVKVLTPEENRVIIQTSLPEALVSVYDRNDFDENIAAEAVKWADVVAVGPGMGTDDTAKRLLCAVLKNSAKPVIIDADGLNIIAADPKLWDIVPKGSVITPHPGEMARLCECTVEEILGDVSGICQGFARSRGVVCVLKDHHTAVSDGRDIYINFTGNSGMATGGSGDVLTGMIGALLAQGVPPFEAACLGAYLHGGAGDLAYAQLGLSMLPSDLPQYIGRFLFQA